MSILNSPKKLKKEYKFVGFKISPRIYHYLILYTLAKETTNAQILRSLLDNWIGEQRKIQSDNDLISDIVQHINIKWKIEKTTNNLTFEEFKKIVEKELIEKGLPQVYINLIIHDLKS